MVHLGTYTAGSTRRGGESTVPDRSDLVPQCSVPSATRHPTPTGSPQSWCTSIGHALFHPVCGREPVPLHEPPGPDQRRLNNKIAWLDPSDLESFSALLPQCSVPSATRHPTPTGSPQSWSHFAHARNTNSLTKGKLNTVFRHPEAGYPVSYILRLVSIRDQCPCDALFTCITDAIDALASVRLPLPRRRLYSYAAAFVSHSRAAGSTQQRSSPTPVSIDPISVGRPPRFVS